MNMLKTIVFSFALLTCGVHASASEGARSGEGAKLTAMLGVDGLYLKEELLADHSLFFLIANSGTIPADISRSASVLYLDDSPVSLHSVRALLTVGPPGPDWKSLSAGASLQFGILLSALKLKPGAHRFMWKGRGFVSNEARVLVVKK